MEEFISLEVVVQMDQTLEWRRASDDKNPRLFSLTKPVCLLKIDEKDNKNPEVNFKAASDEWEKIRKSFEDQLKRVTSNVPKP